MGEPRRRVVRTSIIFESILPQHSARISPGLMPTKSASRKMILSRRSKTDSASRTSSFVTGHPHLFLSVRLPLLIDSYGKRQ